MTNHKFDFFVNSNDNTKNVDNNDKDNNDKNNKRLILREYKNPKNYLDLSKVNDWWLKKPKDNNQNNLSCCCSGVKKNEAKNTNIAGIYDQDDFDLLKLKYYLEEYYYNNKYCKKNNLDKKVNIFKYCHRSNNKCGEDSIILALKLSDDNYTLYFCRYQCAISVATASLLAKLAECCSGSELLRFCQVIKSSIKNDGQFFLLDKSQIIASSFEMAKTNNKNLQKLSMDLLNHINLSKDLPSRMECFMLNLELTIQCLEK